MSSTVKRSVEGLELKEIPKSSSSKQPSPKAVPEAQKAITASADAAASRNSQEQTGPTLADLSKSFVDKYGSLLTTQVTGRPFVTCQASRTQSTKGSTLILLDSLKELPCRQPSSGFGMLLTPNQWFMKSRLIVAKKDCVDKFNVEIDTIKASLEEEKITPDDAKEAAKNALLRLQEHVKNERGARHNRTTKREPRQISYDYSKFGDYYQCQVCEVTRRHPPGNLDKAISTELQEKFNIPTDLPKDGEIMGEEVVVKEIHVQSNDPEVFGIE